MIEGFSGADSTGTSSKKRLEYSKVTGPFAFLAKYDFSSQLLVVNLKVQ